MCFFIYAFLCQHIEIKWKKTHKIQYQVIRIGEEVGPCEGGLLNKNNRICQSEAETHQNTQNIQQ